MTAVNGTTSEVSISSSGGSSEGSPTLSPKTLTNTEGTTKEQRDQQMATYDNLKIIKQNGQIQELQTILRDV